MTADSRPTHSPSLPQPGRILAIDLGEKRIGIAVSDPTQTLARAVTVLKRRSRKEDFSRISQQLAAHDAVGIVMGLPTTLAGTDSATTRWVRDYAAALAATVAVPLVFIDEAMSTLEAAEILHQQSAGKRHLKDRIDAVAAAIILQRYLDALQ